MRKIAFLFGVCMAVTACDKHDPILPGVRDDIFASNSLNILNTNVPNVTEGIATINTQDCPFWHFVIE